MCVSASCGTLIVASSHSAGHNLYAYSMTTGALIRFAERKDAACLCICICPDGRSCLLAGKSGIGFQLSVDDWACRRLVTVGRRASGMDRLH